MKSRFAILLYLLTCSLSASEPVEQFYDPDYVTHGLFIAEEHRIIFLDEISEAPKETLLLFTLGPGGGDHYGQYADAVQMQKVPTYFLTIAETFPSVAAKIYAIDPSFSLDSNAFEYAFLYENGWKLATEPEDYPHSPLRFVKGNVEIAFFKFVVPGSYAEEFTKAVMAYTSSVLDSGGCVFMGHHGSAFGTFKPFSDVYNELQGRHMGTDNLMMYICCGATSPWSDLKVYHTVPYNSEELHTLYSRLHPFFEKWIPSDMGWDQLSQEQQQHILNDYQEGFTSSYQLYHDLGGLEVNIDLIDDKFHLRLGE